MDRSTILVTGGAGYIGSHVVLALLDAGYPVVVLDDLSTGRREAVDSRTAFVQADVRDVAALRAQFAATPIAGVIHLAGVLSAAESVHAPLKYYDTNTTGMIALLTACSAEGVRRVVFSSTAAVYGGAVDGVRTSEDAATVPINPYGASKLMCERILRDAAAAHGLQTCALRYFNVGGADPQARTGQRGPGAGNLIKVALEAATGRRSVLPVFGDDYPTPDGTGVRDYIHVSDLAAAHVLILARLLRDEPTPAVLNCGYGRGYSVREVIAAVERASGRSLPVEVRPRRPSDVASMVADNSRIQRLGWTPQNDSLDLIVGHAWRWEATSSASP
jgi:UDP-glucose 4-epimerase